MNQVIISRQLVVDALRDRSAGAAPAPRFFRCGTNRTPEGHEVLVATIGRRAEDAQPAFCLLVADEPASFVPISARHGPVEASLAFRPGPVPSVTGWVQINGRQKPLHEVLLLGPGLVPLATTKLPPDDN